MRGHRWWVVVLITAAGASVACLGTGLFIIATSVRNDGGFTVSHSAKPNKNSWCSFARLTNGTRLMALTAGWNADGSWSRDDEVFGPKSIVATYNNGAPKAIRADATVLVHGLKANPAQPGAATLAAAQRVDAYVAAECGSPR